LKIENNNSKTSCANTHFYLYAKSHYKKSDILEDLKIIQSKYCGCRVTKFEAIEHIVSMVGKFLEKRPSLFIDFLEYVSPSNSWKVGYTHNLSNNNYNPINYPIYDYYTALAYASLSILRNLSVTDIEEVEKGMTLGEPDFNIFPMFKKD
jgi:hypothetical protein